MLTYAEAKKIGIRACVEKLGRKFVEKHKGSSCTSYGDCGTYASCFVGVSDRPRRKFPAGVIQLSSEKKDKLPYRVECVVNYKTERIHFLECVLPPADSVCDSESLTGSAKV